MKRSISPTQDAALSSESLINIDALCELGVANVTCNTLSTEESAILSNLESAICEGDGEEISQVVRSFSERPSAANRLMDSFGTKLMQAGIYCSWQTVEAARGPVAHLGLYKFDRKTATTFSVLFSTDEYAEAIAMEETIGAERRANGNPDGMMRKQTKIAAQIALREMSTAFKQSSRGRGLGI